MRKKEEEKKDENAGRKRGEENETGKRETRISNRRKKTKKIKRTDIKRG